MAMQIVVGGFDTINGMDTMMSYNTGLYIAGGTWQLHGGNGNRYHKR